MNFYLIPQILGAIVAIFHAVDGSKLEEFFRWIYLGRLMDYVIINTWWIVPILVIWTLYQFIRDYRVLALIAVIVGLFIKFALL